MFVLILLTETENRYWICQQYVAWHAACNVATLGEGDWNYGKLQNVEFGGFKNYGNN